MVNYYRVYNIECGTLNKTIALTRFEGSTQGLIKGSTYALILLTVEP